MTEKRFAAPRLIPFLCLSLLPLFMTALGATQLFKAGQLNTAFAVTATVMPLCYILLLGLVMFSMKMRSSLKVTLGIVLSVVFALSYLLFISASENRTLLHYGADELTEPYAAAKEERPLLPDLTEIGTPEAMDYYDYESTLSLFQNESDTLICRYSPEEYEKEKAALEKRFVFQNRSMTANGYTCPPSVTLDGYVFRVLSFEGEYAYQNTYPNRMTFIATNDETHEIVYLSFCDDDLDYITDLSDFIRDDCGWKHIR